MKIQMTCMLMRTNSSIQSDDETTEITEEVYDESKTEKRRKTQKSKGTKKLKT